MRQYVSVVLYCHSRVISIPGQLSPPEVVGRCSLFLDKAAHSKQQLWRYNVVISQKLSQRTWLRNCRQNVHPTRTLVPARLNTYSTTRLSEFCFMSSLDTLETPRVVFTVEPSPTTTRAITGRAHAGGASRTRPKPPNRRTMMLEWWYPPILQSCRLSAPVRGTIAVLN